MSMDSGSTLKKMRLCFLVIALLIPCAHLPAQQDPLDTTSFIVVGGGLSAGVTDSILIREAQKYSFPALVAAQMNAVMPLPTLRDGGPVPIISMDPGSPVLPRSNQSTLRALPFPLFTFNLSVPLLKVSEALNRRPSRPLTSDLEYKQALINLILGYPGLVIEHPVNWTLIEYLELMGPTFVIVEMGFGDVLDGALKGDPAQMTSISSFTSDYKALVQRIKDTNANVILMTIPDPTDTAYFATLDQAAAQYGTVSEQLRIQFGLQPQDLVTLGGMVEIGDRILGRRNDPLSASAILRSAAATAVQISVRSMNSVITDAATANGFKLFDLYGFMRDVRINGVRAGSRQLSAKYNGGFYSSDGLFPTLPGYAVLANRLIEFINTNYHKNFPAVTYDTIPLTPPPAAPIGPGIESLLGIPKTHEF